MDLDRHLDELRREGERLRSCLRCLDLDMAVPSCPGWTVGQAIRHTTKVHHWVASILRDGDPSQFRFERPADEALDTVLASGLDELLDALRSAPTTLDVWTLVPAPSARVFWARRQAHETAIHRVDLELAADFGVQEFDPDFAADGLDEVLATLAPHRFSPEGVSGVRTIAVTPLDANDAWTLSLTPAGVHCRSGAVDDADLSVFGLSSDLYRWAWNRAGDDQVSLRGDLGLANLWQANFRIGAERG